MPATLIDSPSPSGCYDIIYWIFTHFVVVLKKIFVFAKFSKFSPDLPTYLQS